MARFLRIRDKLLLGLAITGDIFEEIRTGGGFVGSAYRQMYGFVPSKYKKSNFYATVGRMLKSDLLEKVIVGGEPKFRLTPSGLKHFAREFPLIYLQTKKWDRKWRIVIYDIPEGERYIRDRLRGKLKELGFGMIQKSVWISAYPFEDDMKDFLESKNLEKYAYIFLSDSTFFGDVISLVERVWAIEEFNQSYAELLLEYKKVLDKEKFVEKYMQLITQDPYLPKEFLHDPWYGDEARRLFKKMSKTLS